MGGTMRHHAQSPDDYKRERSGFWRHDFDYATGTDRWTCDVRKLREEVGKSMLDPSFSRHVTDHGISNTLDQLFGEGTARAFHTKVEGDAHLVRMDFDRFAQQQRRDDRIDAMAMNPYFAYGSNASTTSSTFTTTSGTADQWHSEFMRETIMEAQQKMIKPLFDTKKRKADPTFKFKKKRVKTFPFKPECNDAKNLLSSLQREFDHWAGDQMKVIAS